MKDIFRFAEYFEICYNWKPKLFFNNETDVNERGAPRDQVAESRGGEKRSTT